MQGRFIRPLKVIFNCGATYSLYNGYNFQAEETGDWGWIAGFAYQIPEKAIRTSLTYRSAIAHKINASEEAPLIDMLSTRSGRDYVGNYLQQLVALGQISPEQQAAINSIVARLPSAGNLGPPNLNHRLRLILSSRLVYCRALFCLAMCAG